MGLMLKSCWPNQLEGSFLLTLQQLVQSLGAACVSASCDVVQVTLQLTCQADQTNLHTSQGGLPETCAQHNILCQRTARYIFLHARSAEAATYLGWLNKQVRNRAGNETWAQCALQQYKHTVLPAS